MIGGKMSEDAYEGNLVGGYKYKGSLKQKRKSIRRGLGKLKKTKTKTKTKTKNKKHYKKSKSKKSRKH